MIETIALHASKLEFPALAAGSGPAVILVHGFPDGPETFRAQLAALAAAGFRAVAPATRGYDAACQPANHDYHLETLACDVIGWVDALGEDRVHLVGHDWGATIAYAATMLAPERFASLTAVAVAHPARMFTVAASDPEQLSLYDYAQFFLSPDAEAQIVAEDMAYLERLWPRWSPNWAIPPEALATMKRRMATPGVLSAALGYYRQSVDGETAIGRRSQALLAGPVPVPTLGIVGADDRCNLARTFVAAMLPEDFPTGVEVAVIPGSGHFPHREQANEFDRTLLDWLASRSIDA